VHLNAPRPADARAWARVAQVLATPLLDTLPTLLLALGNSFDDKLEWFSCIRDAVFTVIIGRCPNRTTPCSVTTIQQYNDLK